MDHHMGGSSSMSMSMTMSMSPTATGSAAAASSTSSMSMGHSHGDMDMGSEMGACKMKMYWNWFTIDACFLHESWHITSKGMFAGTCIGIIFLVMALEFVRRCQREYDRYIVRQWQSRATNGDPNKLAAKGFLWRFNASSVTTSFQPTMVQQIVRSLFYMVQFGGAYIIMLLAMYYNGYIYFCILIGALIGYFIFGSDQIADGLNQENSTGSCCC